MGNDTSDFSIIDENNEEPSLPKVQELHRKGRAYAVMLERKLNGNCYADWAYWIIYDLRNGKETWRLSSKINGDELEFKLRTVEMKDGKLVTKNCFPLYYSTKSNNYMTILKCSSLELELYGDNIHSQRLENLKFKKDVNIFGFIKFDKQDKIPIAF
jgi:hypothetical protein